MRVLHVKSDRTYDLLDIEPTLEEFQRLVGGNIEGVPTVPGYVNEEGLIQGLPYNVVASTIADYNLVGDVVFTGGVDENGDDLPVSDEFLARWLA